MRILGQEVYMKTITFEMISRVARTLLAKGEVPTPQRLKQEFQIDNASEYKRLKEILKKWMQQKESVKFTHTGIKHSVLSNDKKSKTNKKIHELENSLSLVRATLESTTDGILVVSKEGKMVDFNQKFVEIYRIPPEILASGDEKKALSIVYQQVENPEELFKQLASLPLDAKGDFNDTYFKDGRILERYSQPHVVNDEIVGRVWSFRDVTEQRKAQQELLLRNKAIDESYHGVVMLDMTMDNHPIIYVNPAFERITGYSKEEVIGKNISLLYQKEKQQSAIQTINNSIKKFEDTEVEVRCFKKNGEMFWNSMHFTPVKNNTAYVTNYVVIINDITDRKKMEEQLIQQATHDALTGLPNRALLYDRIEQAIVHTNHFAMVFLDLDRFKLINDGHGHDIGDQLLVEISNRLKRCTRPIDTVSRIGGDEFIAIFPGIRDEQDLIPIIEKIMVAIEEPFSFNMNQTSVTASVGISFYPKDGEDANTLMRKADISMYHTKDNGRNSFSFYQEEMQKRINIRVSLEHDLRAALDKDQFVLNYQPLVDLKNSKYIGVEALLRWMHPEKGLIPPSDFIPLAEETGLIIPISEWVIYEACRQNKLWQKMGLPNVYVAINMTAKQFKKQNIVRDIHSIIGKSRLDPKFVELELTETMLIDNVQETIDILQEFKEMGVKMAIDDFGIGYSSLSYLKKFPVDKLKIDRSFVKDLPHNQNDASIAKAIINLAHTLNLNVLAEGIETIEQLKFFTEQGCDQAQGFFFSRPVDALTCFKFIKDNFSLVA